MSDIETLRIERLIAGGDGLAREPGRPVTFVAGTAPGDLVRVEITDAGTQHRRGRVLEILEPGPGRRDAPCPETAACGGCPWMHLTDEAQAEAARDILASALQRAKASVAEGALRPTIALPHAEGRRQRMRLHLDLRSAPVAGFLRTESHDVHVAASCLALEPALETLRLAITQALPALRDALGPVRAELSIDLPREDGGAALLRIREPAPPGESRDRRGARPARRHAPAVGRDALVAALRVLRKIPALTALVAQAGDVRVGMGNDAVGFFRGPLEEPTRWPAFIAPGGFLQAGREGSALLVSRVLDAARDAGLGPGSRVLELFAGSGNLTLPLAGLGCVVEASDSDAQAIDMARRAIAACTPVLWPAPTLLARDAARHLREIIGAGEHFDAVVLDPPRTGARDVAALLAQCTSLVLWVSCDAPTFARDAAILSKSGFEIVRTEPLMLFPQTAHFESVAVLKRVRAPEPGYDPPRGPA